MKLFVRAALAALCLVASASASAANWPSSPVKLVVPSGPGSSPDLFARVLAASMQQRLGQAVFVENKNGASGSMGMDAVSRSPADGYTLGIAFPAPLTTNALMMKKMTYDSRKDLKLLTNAVLQPTVLVIGKHLPAKNFAEFAELLRKNPGKYNSASTGASSLGRLLAEAFVYQLGTRVENIVYAGAAPTMTALMRGDVDFAFLPAAGAMTFVHSDKVRLVALAAPKRSTLLAGVPTLKELGVPGIDASNWLGIVSPAALAPELAGRIRQEVIAALQTPEMKKLLADNYMEVVGSTSEEFAATVDQDTQRWKPLIEKLAITID